MLLTFKNKNQSLPNIKQQRNEIFTIKYTINSRQPQYSFNKLAKSTINSSRSLLSNNNKNLNYTKDYFHIKIKNNSLLEHKNLDKNKNFENIKIYKGKVINVPNNKDINNYINENNKKEMEIVKDFKKRNVYLYRKNFNYFCSMDKNNTINMKLNKNPKKSYKQQTIDLIYEQNNLYNNELKLPRMVGIENRNKYLYNEVFYKPWKYPDFFEK